MRFLRNNKILFLKISKSCKIYTIDLTAIGRWYGSFDPDGTGSVDPARATDPDPSAMDGDPPEIYSDPSANDPDPPAMDPDPPADFCTSAAVPPDVPDSGPNSNFYL